MHCINSTSKYLTLSTKYSLQSCLTLWDPVDCSLPGSTVMRFSRQEYWSGLPCSSSGDLPNPEVELPSLKSPALPEGSLPLVPPGKSIAWTASFNFWPYNLLSICLWVLYLNLTYIELNFSTEIKVNNMRAVHFSLI